MDKGHKITHASLFSGFGAAELAAEWIGWRNMFWCEIDPFPRRVLQYWFTNQIGYEDITKTDFTRWRGRIDVLTGGFPCQPFSLAGRRKGADDDRYLWPEMLRAIREIRPSWVIGENVAGILTMVQSGREIEVEHQASIFEEADKETLLEQEYVIETICCDLEREGYSVQPFVIPACSVGAPHRRDRVWFIARRIAPHSESHGDSGKPDSFYQEERRPEYRMYAELIQHGGVLSETDAETNNKLLSCRNPKGHEERNDKRFILEPYGCQTMWKNFPTQPSVCRGNDGLPFNVERLTVSFRKWREGTIKGYGNAIVPQVMYEIFRAIEHSRINEQRTT